MSESVESVGAAFLSEVRERLGESSEAALAARLAPAVGRMTDRLTVLACDRLSRGDVAAFFETALAAMTPEERTAWRREVTAGWYREALARWEAQEALRREVVQAILAVKAMVL